MHHAISTKHDVAADADVRYDPAIVAYNRFRPDPTMWTDRDVGADSSRAVDYRGRMNAWFDMHGQLSGTRITGTFTEKGRAYVFTGNNAQSFTCSTGTVHFSIRR